MSNTLAIREKKSLATASAKMDKDLKESTEKIFKSMGLNASTAITMFYKAVNLHNKIPFEIIGEPRYNDETLAAFREAEEIRKHPENYKSYNTAQEMLEDILGK